MLELADQSTDAQSFIGLDPQLMFLSRGCNVVSTFLSVSYFCLLITVQGNLSLLLLFWFSPYFLSCFFGRLWADSYLNLTLKISDENHCRGSSLFQCLALCFQEPRPFSTDQENHGQIYSLEHRGNSLVTLGIWYSLYLPRACNGFRDLRCICLSCCPVPWFWWRHFCQMVTTSLLERNRKKCGSNWEFSLCSWKGNHGGVTLLVNVEHEAKSAESNI